ncbi:MAG: hypothetical protein ACE5GW_04320 [Planctomycetota bacterium]
MKRVHIRLPEGTCRFGASTGAIAMSLLVLGFVALFSGAAAAQFWTISGVVQDAQGTGIANVDIDLVNNSNPANPISIPLSGDLTLANGSFSFTTLQVIPTGTYEIEFNPPLGAPFFDLVVSQFLFGNFTFPAPIVLEPMAVLTGRVVDDNGIGLVQANLDFFVSATGEPAIFTGDVTDDLGFFEVNMVPDIYDMEIRATLATPGGPYVPVFLTQRPLLDDLDLGVIALHDGYSLTGIVRTAAGSAVVGGDIDVRDPLTGDKVHTPGDNTGPTGAFSVLVPAGDWEVEVDPPPGPALVAQLIPFAVIPPGPSNMGIIVLPPGVRVTGTTVDSGFSPVTDVDLDFVISSTQVEVPTPHDNADQNGIFGVTVETNTYDIQFKPPFASGLAPLIRENELVFSDVNLGSVVLPAGFGITGTVTAGGTPIEEVELSLTLSSSGAPVFSFGDESDALGHYAIRELAGTYDILYTPPQGSGLDPHLEADVLVNGDVLIDVDLAAAPTPPPPVGSLSCVAVGANVSLSWVNGALDYSSIEVRRDGVLIATLPGSATSHSDTGLPDAAYTYTVIAVRGGLSSPLVGCVVTVGSPPEQPFVRGDGNGDGSADIADAINVLNTLFVPGTPPSTCPDRQDANDDGLLNIADAIYILSFLFTSGPEPSPPYPSPGPDPTPDPLFCL